MVVVTASSVASRLSTRFSFRAWQMGPRGRGAAYEAVHQRTSAYSGTSPWECARHKASTHGCIRVRATPADTAALRLG